MGYFNDNKPDQDIEFSTFFQFFSFVDFYLLTSSKISAIFELFQIPERKGFCQSTGLEKNYTDG